jgi:hypothetical protein
MVGLTNLCSPAEFYLVLSVVALAIMGFQNIGNKEIYCLGDYACMVPNTSIIFFVKLLYVAFWTWILNIICKGGAEWFSWLVVLLPILLSFVLVSFIFLSNRTKRADD